MNMELWIEIIGWVAMCITISSFFFSEMEKLRTVNLIGCLAWIFYGSLLFSVPIIVTNIAIGVTHVHWFLKDSRK